MSTTDYLRGRSEAHEINQRLTVAYYLDSVGEKENAAYHYSLAVKEFKELACAFGFKLDAGHPVGANLHD